jgi:sporulation protein YlmC with PRC-barrel domain
MMKTIAAGACLLTILASPALAQSAQQSDTANANPTPPNFVTQQSPNQWRASKLSGVAVYGSNDQKIGSIDDILIDSHGQAKTAVIGIGGFLGVGQKDVGVPYASLKWRSQTEGRTSANANGSSSSSSNSTNGDYPASAMLDATKDQLQNAPNFKFASDLNNNNGGNGGSSNGAANGGGAMNNNTSGAPTGH